MVQGLASILKELIETFSNMDKKGSGFLVLILALAFMTAKCSSPPSPSSLPAVGGSDTANVQESGIQETEDYVQANETISSIPSDGQRLDLEGESLGLIQEMVEGRAIELYKIANKNNPDSPDQWLFGYLNNYNNVWRASNNLFYARSGKTFDQHRSNAFEVWSAAVALRWSKEGKSLENLEDLTLDSSGLEQAMIYPLAELSIKYPEAR